MRPSGNNKGAVGLLFYTVVHRKKKRLCDFYFVPQMPRTTFYFYFRVRLVEKRGNASGLIKTLQSAGFMMSPGYVRGLISRVCTVQKEQLAQDCARPLALSDIRKEQLAQDCTRPLALLNIWNCHLPIIRRGFRVLNNDVLSCFRDHYVKSADKRASRS